MAIDHGQAVEDALARRDPGAALALALAAELAGVGDGPLYRNKALALRMLGRDREAVAALDAALAFDPYDFICRLSKGALLERLGNLPGAVEAYRGALASAPVPPPAALEAPLQRARRMAADHAAGLRDHLLTETRSARAGLEGAERGRLEAALNLFAAAPPAQLHYPDLPPIAFQGRETFPWLAELEAAAPMILEELGKAQSAAAEDFSPYIAFPPGAPVNQWGQLNHSRRWSAFFLWRDGVRQEGPCDLCPGTAALLASLPMATHDGYAPTAMFSALEPHTHIPPHTGSTNTRLLVHLPLVLPGPARFRVGDQTREWRMGEAWVFDDTIEHEAWNDADQDRAILIFDIWNPNLSMGERAAIQAMMAARRTYGP